jgi:hypothetical protein
MLEVGEDLPDQVSRGINFTLCMELLCEQPHP